MLSEWDADEEGLARLDYLTALLEAGPGGPLPATLLEQLEASRPAWQAQAACRGLGPATFFPTQGRSPERARAVCASCPVRVECSAFGAGEPFGVWGGVSRGGAGRGESGVPWSQNGHRKSST